MIDAVSFKVWFDDAWHTVSLTRDGAPADLVSGGDTDEGFSEEHHHYTFDGRFVWLESSSYDRDCDGRHESWAEYSCEPAKLESRVADDGVKVPMWERDGASQRDHTAEAANY